MPSNLPTVSVVIPARDAAGLLPRALRSVAAQDYPNIVEVIVATADPVPVEVSDGVILIPNPVGTTPAGLNLAVAASTGDVVVRCDAQSVLPPGYVARAVETLYRTGASNVGGMQVPVGETKWEEAIATAMKSPFGSGDARYRIGGEEGPVETVYLGVFRRSAIEDVGGFDERFVRTQDYELNHRIIESGGVVWFDPGLEVEYRPRSSLRALARQYLEYGMAKRRFARKHPGALRSRQLAAPVLVLILAASIVVSIWLPWALLVPVGYLTLLLGVGLFSGSHALRVALALATMHLSWGWGFLFAPGTDE